MAGKVKTRMCPPFSLEQAAELARAFLLDCCDVAMTTGADVWCSYRGDNDLLVELLPEGVDFLAQRGESFDERLANTTSDLFAKGYSRVVLLGADCPTVDADYLAASLDALDTHDVAIGPANDGGYVLLATKYDLPSLFVGIEMGTERVFGETMDRAQQARIATCVLPTCRDLDTFEELSAASEEGALDHAIRTTGSLGLVVPRKRQT